MISASTNTFLPITCSGALTATSSWMTQLLKPFYSQMGGPSVDPELMILMLIVG
jgi:hypothetical protein